MEACIRFGHRRVLLALATITLWASCVNASPAQDESLKTVVVEPYTVREGRARFLRHRVDGKVASSDQDGLATAVRAAAGGVGDIRVLIKVEPRANLSPIDTTLGALANHELMREIHGRIREMALEVAGMDGPVKVGWRLRRTSERPTVRLRTAPSSRRAPELRPVQVSPDADFSRIDVLVPVVTGADEYRVRGEPRIPRTTAWARRLEKGSLVVVDVSTATGVRVLVAATVMRLLAEAGAVPTLPGVHDWKPPRRRAGESLGDHRGGRRNLRALGAGGMTQVAVERGLEWLARHQSRDGRWDCDGFLRRGDPGKGPLCDGQGDAAHDVGVSGLAVLAFLGAGNTHLEGNHNEAVRNGLKWLTSQQDSEGCFGSRSHPHFIYNHAIGALAMAEAYGMTLSGIWKSSAQNGINYVMKCQNPYKAWRYGERPGDNDMSITGWMVTALQSAKAGGLEINDRSMHWAHDFCKEMTNKQTGRTGYTKRGERPVRAEGRLQPFPAEESESLTAVGMLVRIFAGEDPKTSAMIKAGADLCSKCLPEWSPNTGKVDMYYWYWGSLAMFQVGGAEWTAWNNKMKEAIVNSQRKDGNFAGSWDPVGPWSKDGGRAYSTAMMTLCLEVYYRYARLSGRRK